MQSVSHGAAPAAFATKDTAEVRGEPRAPAESAVRQRLIVIVGAGFSGTAVATSLLRAPPADPTRIVLVDPREEIGAGVAYASRDYPYPLNVTAGQMSLDASAPDDFLSYLHHVGIHAAAGDFLPRQVYGEYLRARFHSARATAPAHVECVHHRATALQLRPATAGTFDLWLDDGTGLRADQVVLAPGNPPPAELPVLRAISATDRYVRDPWSIGALTGVESVLLVGSGLTMIDAALRLAAIRPRLHRIHVLSRHGRLPQPQATEQRPALKPDLSRVLEGARGSIRALFRALRTLMSDVDERGGDWREVLALLRSEVPSLWSSLDMAQRARFLRHVRSIWDVHRHRVPAGPLAAVHSLCRLGVLDVHAGRLERVTPLDDTIEVIWKPRGHERSRAWLVDRVINCTGPDCQADNHGSLVKSLLSNGLMRRDALGLGIDVATDGRVIARDGVTVDRLFYIGPWLRARDWEGTAVPELREHARLIARQLASRFAVTVTR